MKWLFNTPAVVTCLALLFSSNASCHAADCRITIPGGGIKRTVNGTVERLVILPDHQGGARLVLNGGTVVEKLSYEPYGRTIEDTPDSTTTTRKYTGQEKDDSTGLYNYNARLYDPAAGLFISADTLIPEPASPRTWNRYVYCYGDPVNFTDPSGHAREAVDKLPAIKVPPPKFKGKASYVQPMKDAPLSDVVRCLAGNVIDYSCRIEMDIVAVSSPSISSADMGGGPGVYPIFRNFRMIWYDEDYYYDKMYGQYVSSLFSLATPIQSPSSPLAELLDDDAVRALKNNVMSVVRKNPDPAMAKCMADDGFIEIISDPSDLIRIKNGAPGMVFVDSAGELKIAVATDTYIPNPGHDIVATYVSDAGVTPVTPVEIYKGAIVAKSGRFQRWFPTAESHLQKLKPLIEEQFGLPFEYTWSSIQKIIGPGW